MDEPSKDIEKKSPEIENKKLNNSLYSELELETLKNNADFTYIPEKFNKCLIPKDEFSKHMKSIALRFILYKFKYPKLNVKYFGSNEAYIINREWYKIWKKNSKYDTMKRIIKSYGTYENKPIPYKIIQGKIPEQINNNSLLIKNKLGKDGRNILVSKNNKCIDTKLDQNKDYKIISKEKYQILNSYFNCDYIIKGEKKEENKKQNYDIYSIHLNLVFLPILETFKKLEEEKLDEFIKTHKIKYDVYFNAKADKKEILMELKEILKENPNILINMGIKDFNENEIEKNLEFIRFYLPNDKSKKLNEILDYIFSKDTILKLKKGEKIKETEINLLKENYNFKLSKIYNYSFYDIRENIDNVDLGYIILEYLPSNEESVFEVQDSWKYIETNFPVTIVPIPQVDSNKPPNKNMTYSPGRESDSDHPKSRSSSHNPYHKSPNNNLNDNALNENVNRAGIVGLNNLGNTCYMNTGLQCLSNCELLTTYFLKDYYKQFINKDNPMGSKGDIVEKYSQLIHHLWYGGSDCISPMKFKQAFGRMYNAFNDFRQQDSQEFISYLLDALHEDLNKVINKPYIQATDFSPDLPEEEQFQITKNIYMCRNQSIITDLFYGFYKSTIYCPDEKCKNIRKGFEPYNMITLSLINEREQRKMETFNAEKLKKEGIQVIDIIIVPFKMNFQLLHFPMKIKKNYTTQNFFEKIEIMTGFNYKTFDIYKIEDNELIPLTSNITKIDDFLNRDKTLYLYQIPPYVFEKPLDYFDSVFNKLINNPDKLYLEEERYDGNDLYNEYNGIEEKENKQKKNEENKGEQMTVEIEDKTETDKIDNNKDDFEMKDDTLEIKINKWIKAELYYYSYWKKNGEEQTYEERRIANSRFIYINLEDNDAEVYDHIMKIFSETKELKEIKDIWLSNIDEAIKDFSSVEGNIQSKIIEKFDNNNQNPIMLQYLKAFNIVKDDSKSKKEGWNNIIFSHDKGKYTIKNIINELLEKKNDINDIQLMFKIIWKPNFTSSFEEIAKPEDISKGEKLEEIFSKRLEKEYKEQTGITITTDSKEKNDKSLELENLLQNFSQKETLTEENKWYCQKCKKSQLAEKKLEIYSVNEIVIIHLKRFRNNRKIETKVNFPLEGLNLGDYLPDKNQKYIYDLFAVANHVGGLNGGHYFAYCKNFKDQDWYEFNDSNVYKIFKDMIISPNAYVLFYKRRREEIINVEEIYKRPFIKIDYSKYK